MCRAPLITIVPPGRAVLDKLPTVAATATHLQLRVKLLKRARTESTQATDRRSTESWTDETVDEQPVRRAGRLLDLMTS